MIFRDGSANLPRYLYKYYSNLEYAKDAILNKRIHLDDPGKYNDVFDCAFSVNDSILKHMAFTEATLTKMIFFTPVENKETFLAFGKNLMLENIRTAEAFERYKQVFPEEIIESIKYNMSRNMKNLKPSNNKVSCFSELCDSELMWAHYGNSLQGACLKFDTTLDVDLFKHIRKVNYTNYRINDFSNKFDLFFTKSLHWSYEQEWRIVVDTDDEYVRTKSCVGIILGERMPLGEVNNEIGILELSFYGMNNDLEVLKARANPFEYKIDIGKR